MKHIGTETLHTKRLSLRRFSLQDVGCLYANWANDAEVVKYMRMSSHKDINDTRDFVESIINKYEKLDTY